MRKKTKKKIFMSLISILLVGAMGAGIYYGVTHNKKDPIPVISFADVGMTEYWGDNMESHGPVSSDNIQTVFLSDTQTVTEVLVKEGDTVKKGDPMMTFDTTLSALDLERKRLEVEKLKLELLDAEDELKRIMGMRPMQLPPEIVPEEPDLGSELSVPYRISGKPGFDGSAADKPLIVWMREGVEVDQRMVDDILEMAMSLRLQNSAGASPSGNKAEKRKKQDSSSEDKDVMVPTLDAETVPQTQPTETESVQTEPPETESAAPQRPAPAGVVQPASREEAKLGVVIARKLTFRKAPSMSAEVIKEIDCSQAAVRIYDQVSAEGKEWGFVVLGIGDYATEGWVVLDGNISIQEPHPTVPSEPADPQKPTDPADPPEPPVEPAKVVTVNFLCEPADAQVTLTRASNTIHFEKIGRNIFKANPGVYYYSVQYDGYKPVVQKKLEVRENDIDVVVKLESYQDLSKLNSCYVVFKSTDKNMSLGGRKLWQGVKLYQSGHFKFYDAGEIPDYTMAAVLPGGEEDAPSFDMGSGMTGAQIAELRAQQEKKIEELKLNVKMADAEYKIKKRELEDGNIYADFDGKVVSLLTEEESRQRKKPMIKVSGGGGFQVEGSVNELDREIMKIGQKVTVNDWNSGGSYEGKIISIGEFPVRMRGYNGRGNPNSSYYPFTVFVDGEADLQTGSYVSIQYAAGESQNGIYLNNPFVREEKGQSYVYVLGENDRLEKRNVTTGKALWGSYTEITSGLSKDDYLAFPYGKNVKPGAKAKIGDMSDFYS